ncbi:MULTISPECIES: hypothetical protein [unclassified Streptomyces]|nr:hypothetical protein [Streptomyces sp. CB02959]
MGKPKETVNAAKGRQKRDAEEQGAETPREKQQVVDTQLLKRHSRQGR